MMRQFVRRAVVIAVACGISVYSTRGAAREAPTRDGFYLRMGAGAGWLLDSGEAKDYSGVRVSGTITGGSLCSELSMALAPTPGLYVGAFASGHYLSGPSVRRAEVTSPTLRGHYDVDFDSAALLLFGPYADYYPWPTAGWHLAAGLGLAYGGLGDGSVPGYSERILGQSGLGFGGVVGLGVDWSISERWSIGPLVRLAVASISASDSGAHSTNRVFAPAILLSVVRN